MKMLKIAAILLAAAAPVAFGWTAGADESTPTNSMDAGATVAEEESTPDVLDNEDEATTAESTSAVVVPSLGCPFHPLMCWRFCRSARPGTVGVCVGPARRLCKCQPVFHPPGGPSTITLPP